MINRVTDHDTVSGSALVLAGILRFPACIIPTLWGTETPVSS